ncbi:MAG TPA: phosphatase PAP2 family protein [Natrialbaceae archaeon]|nr:phosphatase PAP2 family protein [Natrialbaceae archaeon]
MARGIGAIDAVQTALPDVLAVLIAVVTQFGDVVVFVPALTLVLWFGDRDRGAALIGVALGGVGIVLIAKHLLAFARPPTNPPVPIEDVPAIVRSFYEAEVTADGYGFPSGHATAATVVWGSLAWWLDASTRPRRVAVAAGLVVLVAFSRVALGVHYVVDVVAGIGLGLAYLLAVAWVRNRVEGDERLFLWLAVGLAAVGGLLQGGQDGWLAVGAAVGATVGWSATDAPIESWPTARKTVVRAVVVIAAVAALAGTAGVGLIAAGLPEAPALGLATGLTAGAFLATPGVRTVSDWVESGDDQNVSR